MLLTFIRLPFVIKIFVLSIVEWRFYTGFTVPKSHSGSIVNLAMPSAFIAMIFSDLFLRVIEH